MRNRNMTLRLPVGVALALSTCFAMAAGRVDLSGIDSSTENQRFIVKYREDSMARQSSATLDTALNNAAAAVPRGQNASSLRVNRLRTLAAGQAEVITTSRPLNRVDSETLMRQIAADPNVEYVEVDAIMRPTLVPNDPSLSSQWSLGTTTAGINIRPAWDKATGTGVVVAVLDTGKTSHPDLNANYLPGYDFISDTTVARDGNGRDNDPSDPGDKTSGTSSWHGTHVAGTVAALTNNGVGVAGVAYNAKILPVRVLGVGGGYTSDIADAIVWASGGTVNGVPTNSNPAEVINMSLGGSSTCSTTYQNAINSAVARGTTIVVAAGNSNANVSTSSPANCANVIAVAATTSAGSRSSFSNYGTGITLSAPGSSILSTLNSGTTSPGNPSYAYYDGTSMATPHVAGVVALMQSVASTPLTPAQVTSILKSTARALPGTCSGGCGAGIVNAEAAVNAVLALSGTPQPVRVLQNGVPITSLSGAANSAQYFTITVPANATNLVITQSASSSGDADLYVKFGSQPTTSSYDCRPYVGGTGTETCTFASPQAGTYHVMLRGYNAFAGVSLTGSYQAAATSQTLQNGVPVTGLSGAASSTRYFTITVPANTANLVITKSASSSGDADLYVKFGSQPTTSSYDCRPYLGSTSAETCTFTSPQAGTYHVLLRGYNAFAGVSLTGSYSAALQTYTNSTTYTISDNSTVESPITVSGRSGNAPTNAVVNVNITHTWRGDLVVDLVAPNGTTTNLHNRTGGSADDIVATYTLNLSGKALNGTWRLRVKDAASGDTGYIRNWSIRF